MENEAKKDRRRVVWAGGWVLLTAVLTTVHHVYSGMIYPPESVSTGVFGGSWRIHGFITLLAPLLACLAALHLYERTHLRAWAYLFSIVNGTLFIGVISLWEGGWNHVVKLIVFALGFGDRFAYGPAWLMRFPVTVPPTDVFFEATGVLTLVVGLFNLHDTHGWLSAERQSNP